MDYEILQHTGDAKIRVLGETKEELFLNALQGMSGILGPKLKIKNEKVKKTIKIVSSDINALLVDFLNEVNYLRQVNMEMYDGVKFSKFSDTGLIGELEGHKVEEFGEDIKAVTFHELDIRQNKEGAWETIIVFDI